jgi:hypothetical protein
MKTKLLTKGRAYVEQNTLHRVLTFVQRDELIRNRYWFTCPDYADADNPKGCVYVSQHEINRKFRPA